MKLGGIVPALVTTVDAEGRFVSRPFEQLLERVYAAGCDGVYVCGQTGEGLLLEAKQRRAAAEAAVRNSPAGKQVIVHVGAYRTAEAVELASHASQLGVAAISSLPPLGSNYSFAEIRGYYEAILAAADAPVLLYWFPELCPTITETEQILELLELPGVAGLKFTDFDLYRMALIKDSGAVVFNGRDEVLVAGLLMGADGGIGTFYNLTPELFVELYRLARSQQWAAARAVQARINELIRITLRFPALAAVKRMLEWSGIQCGPVLAPRRGLTPEEERRLAEALATSSFAAASFAGARTP